MIVSLLLWLDSISKAIKHFMGINLLTEKNYTHKFSHIVESKSNFSGIVYSLNINQMALKFQNSFNILHYSDQT
jgi:hypothetical protein